MQSSKPEPASTTDATTISAALPVTKVMAAGMQQCLVGGAQRTDLQLEATLRSQAELERRLAPISEGASLFRRRDRRPRPAVGARTLARSLPLPLSSSRRLLAPHSILSLV